MIKWKINVAALALLACLGPQLATAQTVEDDAPPTTNPTIKLPNDISILGKADPKVRKATAIVNGEIITGTDVDQRLALIQYSNGGNIPADELERLRLQVVRNLIDETLQIQEAKSNKIDVTNDDVDRYFKAAAARFKKTPAEMTALLAQTGSSDRSYKRQIRGEISWSRLLRRKVEDGVNVSDDEVNEIIAKLKASKGKREYRVSEIYMAAVPENAAQVMATERKIMDQLRNGGSFAAYARQFSESSTAAVGGDLGWVRPEQLPEVLGQRLVTMKVGEVEGPIQLQTGLDILYLVDSREILAADARDAMLSLRQLSITFPAGTTFEQAKAKSEEFGAATKVMQGCGKAKDVATRFGAETVDSDVKMRDLPPLLQELMGKMQIGESTVPIGSLKDGVRVFVLCGRDDPKAPAMPDANSIREGMTEQRVNIRAQRYLRDLRRDAIIEYR